MRGSTFSRCSSIWDSTAGCARSSEETHYGHDSGGRLYCAAFAQTPQSGQTGYQTEAAASRCRTDYIYDPSGRVLGVENYWDTYNGSGFNVEAVLANDCAYEYTNLNRGLKTSSSFYKNAAEGSSSWTLDHTETYSYDPSLDFLTGANYGDGLPNQTPSWSYDAAQNRTDSVVDNLNRTTSIGGVTTTCDILGNRLTDGSKSYGWDCLNRMTSYNGSANSYVYRADGMRVSKVAGSTATVYRYDGQMGMEDVDTTGSTVKVTDYGLRARGVDYISATQSGTTTVGFPIYDAHGNMTACIFRYGSNYYSVNNQRHYDAWGVIRSGAATGDPKGRYCANLGHKQDDESGLVYMRARYFEPSSGRFTSEDPHRRGPNPYIYGSDNPVTNSDANGKDDISDTQYLIGSLLKLIGFFFLTGGLCYEVAEFPAALEEILNLATDYQHIVSSLQQAFEFDNEVSEFDQFKDQLNFLRDAFLGGSLPANSRMASGAVLALAGYDMFLEGELLQDQTL